jgi:hypothetical protein
MSETTHKVLTSPAPGTVIAPIHQYSEQQAAQIKGLRQARREQLSGHWETTDVNFGLHLISMRTRLHSLKQTHISHGSSVG